MNDQGYRFGVGVLVVASLVIAIILIMFFGAAPNLFAERYTVTIRFEAAPGVTTDTPVRKNGVQIGRVKSVKLLDEDGVDLTLELDSQYKVRARELPRIGTGSIITGDAVVEFIPPTVRSLVERFDGTAGSLEDGMLDENEQQVAAAYIQNEDFLSGGIVADDPLDALLNMQDSFNSTLSSIDAAGQEITGLAADLRTVIGGGDGEIRQIAEQARMTIANFNQTLDAIESVFANPALEETINTISVRLPGLVDETELAIEQAGTTIAAFERTAVAFEEVGRTADVTLQDVGTAVETTLDDVGNAVSGISTTIDNINEFTEPLAQQGDQIVSQALGTLRNADALMADLRVLSGTVNQVANRINNGQGTFAKLVDDPQLYYSLVNTLQNIEVVTRRLQPIIEDARVASDKIARDPSSMIDIRGAVFGRPRGSGLK